MKLRKLRHGQFALDAYLMRTNSAVADRSWVAQIIGTHPRFIFEQKFVPRERIQSRGTDDGRQTFGPLRVSEIYEYRCIAFEKQSGYSYRRSGGRSGFFHIVDDQFVKIEKCQILADLYAAAKANAPDAEPSPST